MMDLAPFLTQIVTGQGKTAAGPAGLLHGKTEGASSAGASGENTLKFFDLLFRQTAPALETQAGAENTGADTKTEESKTNFTLPELAILSLIDDQKLPADFKNLRVERIEQRIDEINKLVDHLTNGLPPGLQGKPFVAFLVQRLDHRIETLRVRLDSLQSGEVSPTGEENLAEAAPLPLLIAAGVKPAELTTLDARIREVEEKLGRKLTVEDIIAGVGGLLPVPEQHDLAVIPHEILPDKIMQGAAAPNTDPETGKEALPAAAGPLPFDAEPGDDIAAALNGIVVGGMQGGAQGGDSPDENFSADKQNFQKTNTLQKLVAGALDAGGADKKADRIIKTGFSSFPGIQNHLSGELTLPGNWQTVPSQGIDLSGFDIHAGLPLSPAAQAAHAATSVPQAGQPHPAAQMVALTLTKAGKEGSAKTMTIQLDPPELGRVNVRLEFGHENSVRAHLLVEKPETYLMLQRDSALLNQALQNAGLDTDGSGGGLDFELAADGGAFDRQNNENGNSAPDPSGEDMEAGDILETTMTWQVDPDSGHVHYNILA
ncbi:MAG: flagellar hook-length control protein FliK [Rhodospirillales bacterium]|nr:flagellar hook-length control protein FliK [Alphaproteobacteria bacterium]USO02953.1 MAG: flagellar hook-length control protein FliK [Rhodospirillales bacterium]